MRLEVKWQNGWAWAHGTGPDGRRIRKSLKTRDPGQAEEARAALENRLWKASLYGVDEVLTFDQCALQYAEDGGDTRFLVKVARILSGQRLKDITPKMIRDAAKRAYPNASNATRNRQGITPARAVINYGHEQGWCAYIRVKGFPVKAPKRKAVDREYLDTLRPHLPPNLFALLLFLHTTGRRVGEAVALESHQVAGNTVHIPITKNGDPAVAHLTPEVAILMRSLEPIGGRVFGYKDRRSVYGTLKRACKRAGVEYLGTHQVGRHSFATALSEGGWSSTAIAESGGWKSVRLVDDTYIHPTDLGDKVVKFFSGKK